MDRQSALNRNLNFRMNVQILCMQNTKENNCAIVDKSAQKIGKMATKTEKFM